MWISRLHLVRVLLVVIVLYLTSTTIVLITSRNDVKQTCDENDRNSKGQVERKYESLAESLSELMSKADIIVTELEHGLKDISVDKDDTSRSITNVLVYLKNFLAKTENLQEQHDITIFMSQPVINNHTFSYIHNPEDACSRNKLNVLLVLPSAPNNLKKRQVSRSGNRGDYVKEIKNKAKMLFFLGRPGKINDSISIQQKIDKESKQFGDIVQEDFEDVYTNNRLKSVSMLRWASTFCQNTKYVIRSDDDITVNMSLLISVLDRAAEKKDSFIIGRQRVHDRPAREPDNKYYLSEKEYPPATFPPFLLGGLIGYPIKSVKLLYEAALRVDPIWLEDVYISALCASKVHVPILTDPDFTFYHLYS